ncbi:MAG: sulfurtransferase TusA family protein [Methylotenera sp.]|nr:sulfurtransferase TusA family protein [Methylotenera sp.]
MHFHKELDASGLNCPLPILRCKKGLSDMEASQVLKITATDPGSVKDFNAFCMQTRHELLQLEEENSAYIFYIRKRSN